MLDLIKDKNTNNSLLDFGCGLGHLYEFILKNNYSENLKYSGLDINLNFYNHCSSKYSDIQFYLKDVLKDNELPNFDYIVCNGTFTEKRDLTYDEMYSFMTNVLLKLWDKTNKGISFNVMSKLVDWERDDLFHVSMDESREILEREKQSISRLIPEIESLTFTVHLQYVGEASKQRLCL